MSKTSHNFTIKNTTPKKEACLDINQNLIKIRLRLIAPRNISCFTSNTYYLSTFLVVGGRVIVMKKYFEKKFGEGTAFDLDYGKLLIIALLIYIAFFK